MRPAWTLPLALLVVAACTKESEDPVDTITTAPNENLFPLPPDVDDLDWTSIFIDAVEMMKTVNTQGPWAGHLSTMDTRQVGCPDFWTGQFTVATVLVGSDDGVAWYDDCVTGGGLYYDGWLWWDSDVVEDGDPTSYEGRTSDATRTLQGDALVGDETNPVRYEFEGDASDSFYNLEANGYSRFTYSSTVDGTVTGTDMFAPEDHTPEGYRTDLFQFISGGDVDTYEARGNVYMFTPQLHDRFDSIQVDMAMVGANSAGPDDCPLEPLGWIGVRDENAYWYDVVFLPRFEEDIAGEQYPNDPLSVCDGCGRLYIQGVEQDGKDVCVDFSFLFDGTFPLPDPDDYILPFHAL